MKDEKNAKAPPRFKWSEEPFSVECGKMPWGLGIVVPETSRGLNDIVRKLPLKVLRSKDLMLLQACTRRYGDFQAL